MEKIFNVSNSNTTSITTGAFLMTGNTLNDETILTCIREAGTPDDGSPLSFLDAVAALVAEKLLNLGLIKGGGRLVLPTAGIITRNYREGILDTDEMDDGTLISLRRRMSEAIRHSDAMRAGLKLGDRGVHYAAGFGGGYMKRTMGGKDRLQYAAQMAKTGYGTALEIARAHRREQLSPAIMTAAPVLIENLGSVISVMIAINPRVKDITRELRGQELPIN